MKLSKRLMTAAAMISEGAVLADVGTDHGYVPIYLLEQKKIRRAVAMDINRGPLARAEEHIKAYGMGDYIQTRLSDGVAALTPGEADVILIAGMGGGLILHILETGKAVCTQAKELVLQPQSEIARVRAYLFRKGYVITEEQMVCEDGKYYPMMRVHYEPERAETDREMPEGADEEDFSWLDAWILSRDIEEQVRYYYGGLLLEAKNPVLRAYLLRERRIYSGIEQELATKDGSTGAKERLQEVRHMLWVNEQALCGMEEGEAYE